MLSWKQGPCYFTPYLKDLSIYNPMYFLFGVDPGLDQSKFQFSLCLNKNPEICFFHSGLKL